MPINVGLMGFGRMGRNLFRILYNRDDIRVAAISDAADDRSLEYLLKYDSILGRFPGTVRVEDSVLHTDGEQTHLFSRKEPGDIDWKALGVDVVIEATPNARSRSELSLHLDKGAQQVVLCGPSTDEPDITVAVGVNDDQLTPEHRIVSNASIVAHGAAPVLQIIEEAFGIERAFLTTVHAYTEDQRLADVPAQDLRQGRAAGENIIPTEINDDQVLGKLLPQLEGKLTSLALKVPVSNGSLVDLTTFTQKPVTASSLNEAVRSAFSSKYKDCAEYIDDPIVSSDVKGSPYSSTFDAQATICLGDNIAKTITWFDNGWGYAHRVVDLVGRLQTLNGGAA